MHWHADSDDLRVFIYGIPQQVMGQVVTVEADQLCRIFVLKKFYIKV
jgi:hypothetical protein